MPLPASAVVFGADRQAYIMVFEPNGDDTGTIRRMPVTLNTEENGSLTLAEPPQEPLEIVVAGANRLSDGQAVRRFTGFGD